MMATIYPSLLPRPATHPGGAFHSSVAFGTPYRSALPAGRSGPSLRPSRTASLTLARSRRSSGCSAIRASWISASIIGMLSTGLSAHSHQRSKERRANFNRVLFQRQFTDKLHDAIFDDIGFNADP